jgi:hypothetical protein
VEAVGLLSEADGGHKYREIRTITELWKIASVRVKWNKQTIVKIGQREA